MSYTTPAIVRHLLPSLLEDEDIIGVISSGTHIRLSVPAISVTSLVADGTAVTSFTFTRPDKITLGTAATGENFIATCSYGLSDSRLQELIEQADNIIDSEFLYLQKPSLSYLANISGWLTVSLYLKGYASATEENMARADSYMKLATDSIKSLRAQTGTPTRSWVRKVNA